MRSGSNENSGRRGDNAGLKAAGAERVAAAAAKLLFVSALLGVLIASACGPSAGIDRSVPAGAPAPPQGATPTETDIPGAPVTPTEILTADAGLPDALDPAAADAGPSASMDAAEAGSSHADVAAAAPDGLAHDAAISGSTGPGTPDVAPVRRVALVVLDPNNLAPGDVRVRAYFELKGFAVRLLPDTATASDVNGAGLVVISSSTRAFMVADHLRDVPIALIAMKASLFDDLAMTGAVRDTDYGEADAAALEVVGDGHPLCAGLRGTVRAALVPMPMAWGRPSPSALRIASLAGDPGRLGIFAYEKGATMIARAAPARRIGFFATERMAAQSTSDAVLLLDAAVEWAVR
jgi:hypothetical protein